MFDEEEIGIGSDVKSGDEEGTPVHSPTIPEDEGNTGDGTGEGKAAPTRRATSPTGTPRPPRSITPDGSVRVRDARATRRARRSGPLGACREGPLR